MYKALNNIGDWLPSAALLRAAQLMATFAVALLMGCSSDVADTDVQHRGFKADGSAFLRLDIMMNSAIVTRSGGDNGTFDNGTTDERKVKNAYLLLFSGADETSATFASAYSLASIPDGTDHANGSQVETTRSVVQQIYKDHISEGDHLYAFVILNAYDGLVSSFAESELTIGSVDITTSSTLADLQTITIDRAVSTDGYYLMTNAPMSNVAGGSLAEAPAGSISTLKEIPQSRIYATAALAEANPAAEVCVERATVKLTVTSAPTPLAIANEPTITFDASDVRWTLDRQNTTAYLVRHVADSWLTLTHSAPYSYRFADGTAAAAGQWRTYWATDPNYTGDSGLTAAKARDYAFDDATADNQTTYYTLENTFDHSAQKRANATTLLVRLTLNGGTDFYTVSTETVNDIYQLEDNPAVEEKGTGAGESFKPRRSAKLTTPTIDTYVRQWLKAHCAELATWVGTYAASNWDYIKVHMTNDASTGTATATITQTAQKSGSAGATAFNALTISGQTLNEYVNSSITFKYYSGGHCFYRGFIKHFGDELTPWTSGGYTAAGQLGRYGLVRDNQYRLTISSFQNVGEPLPPALTDNNIDP